MPVLQVVQWGEQGAAAAAQVRVLLAEPVAAAAEREWLRQGAGQGLSAPNWASHSLSEKP